MPRQRDWLDYAHLASSVVQNIQLSSANQALAQLRVAEQNKASKEERIDRFKSALFKLEDELEEFKQLPPEIVRERKLFWLTATSGQLDQLRATAELSFEGMDRWRSVKGRLDILSQALTADFSPAQIADIKQAYQWVTGLGDLECAIDYYRRREELEQLKRDIATVTARVKEDNATGPRLLLVGALVSFVGGFVADTMLETTGYQTMGNGLGVLCGLLWLAALFHASSQVTDKVEPLQQRIRALETGGELDLATLELFYTEPVEGVANPTAAQLHALYVKRITFINRITGADMEPKTLVQIAQAVKGS